METIRFTKNEAAARTIAAYYDTPPMLYVHSFGCQQNVNDGEKIKGVLTDIGFGLAARPEDADLIVFNTCAVREHAEQRVFGNVGALKKLKEQNPRLMIGVCGCMAQQEKNVEKIKKSYPQVNLLFGTHALWRFPSLLYRVLTEKKRVFDIGGEDDIAEGLPVLRAKGAKAWLSIMYGCNNFCTYCIVPYVRGRERSRRPEEIEKELRELVAAGYKEITLLGQNVNSYGKDLGIDVDFADLLRRLLRHPGRAVLGSPVGAGAVSGGGAGLLRVRHFHPRHGILCGRTHRPGQSGEGPVPHGHGHYRRWLRLRQLRQRPAAGSNRRKWDAAVLHHLRHSGSTGGHLCRAEEINVRNRPEVKYFRPVSVSKKPFRHAEAFFRTSKKF